MRLVLIAGTGTPDAPHDDAGLDATIETLAARGVNDLTLVTAAGPEPGARPGLQTLAPFGFDCAPDRRASVERHRKVLDAAAHGTDRLAPGDPALALVEAVRHADAVLVAGGSALGSEHPAHLYERATLAAVATRLGRPVALTGLGVGPVVRDADEPLLTPLLASAAAVGARDASSTDVASAHGVLDDRLVAVLDDAYATAADDTDRETVAGVRSDRYVVACFDGPLPGEDPVAHRALVAATLVGLADVHDADVVVVPRAGAAHDDVARLADDPRVRTAPPLAPRALAALLEGAALMVGTRHDAGVIALRTATPTILVAPDMSASLRMRGAARAVGLGSFVLGVESWRTGDVLVAARELRDRDTEVRAHLAAVREVRLVEHAAWWDAVVARLRDARPLPRSLGLAPVPEVVARGGWAPTAARWLDATEAHGRETTYQRLRIEELEHAVRTLRAASATRPASTVAAPPVEVAHRRRRLARWPWGTHGDPLPH